MENQLFGTDMRVRDILSREPVDLHLLLLWLHIQRPENDKISSFVEQHSTPAVLSLKERRSIPELI